MNSTSISFLVDGFFAQLCDLYVGGFPSRGCQVYPGLYLGVPAPGGWKLYQRGQRPTRRRTPAVARESLKLFEV